jgi:hypothetical protein
MMSAFLQNLHGPLSLNSGPDRPALSPGVNIVGYCKKIPEFFDVAFIPMQNDKYPSF